MTTEDEKPGIFGDAPAGGIIPAQNEAAKRQAERRKREAAKLRENLSRRKTQLRARRAGEAEAGEGLPAAKTDES